MNGDTESSVDVARSRAERLISEGAQLLVGAFDSGQTTAIAQVAEQRGIPLVINIAAAPPITEQGYKFVFRNFPTAPMILGDAFANQLEIFSITGKAPKTAVFMHVNDTFGAAMQKGFTGVMSKFPQIPYKVVDTIAYDPAARDLSVEVAKAKASGAEALVLVSRLNDAILLTRELVKQRWSPMSGAQHGPGLVRGPVPEDARQARRRAAQLRSLVRPEQDADASSSRPRTARRSRRSTSTRTTSTPSRRCWSRRTRSSAQGPLIPRRSPTRSAPRTSRTMSAPVPASSSTPRARTRR